MTRRWIGLAAVCVASLLSAPASAAVAAAGGTPALRSARYTSFPVQGVGQSEGSVGGGVPMWSSSISSLGHTFHYSMVGKSPFIHQASPSTTIATDVIPVQFTFQDSGHVFDPTAPDATCSPSGTALDLSVASPVFQTHVYTPGGTNVGTVQYLDGFQRSNFAKQVVNAGAINPGYHVILKEVTKPTLLLTVAPSAGVTQAATCGSLGLLDINAWNQFVVTNLTARALMIPSHLPVFLFYGVVLYDGGNPANCCILGYHSGFTTRSHAIQTFAVADFDMSQDFTGGDVAPLSHEVGEWIDDPLANNGTPAWGHIGQVQQGCQSNLEVGDPLSGTTLAVTMPNNFTYHPQELAFFSWFYRQSPSIGVNGWFSSNATFLTPPPACP